MRIRDPKTTALVFASGKMVCTGAKSEEHSRLAARKVKSYCHIVLPFHMQGEIVDGSQFLYLLNFGYETNVYLMLFSIAVCENCPEARLPSSVQGNAFAILIRSESKMFPDHLDSMGSGDMQDFKIQNMVGSCDVKFPIRLEGLALASGNFANVRIYSSAISNIWTLVLDSFFSSKLSALPCRTSFRSIY